MEGEVTELMERKDALMFLRNRIGKDWRNVGRNLDLTDPELDHIEADNQLHASERCYQMLRAWVSKNGKAATVKVLAKALCNSGKQDLADELVKVTNPAASSNKTQSGCADVNRDTQANDAERHKPGKLLAPGIIFILFAVSIVIVAYYVGPNTKDDSLGLSERKLNRDEFSKDNMVEHDKLDIAINNVKNSLTKEWQAVGRHLGLSDPDIEHISEEYDRNPKERSYQMLQKWRKQFGKRATLDALKDALIEVKRQDLADKLP